MAPIHANTYSMLRCLALFEICRGTKLFELFVSADLDTWHLAASGDLGPLNFNLDCQATKHFPSGYVGPVRYVWFKDVTYHQGGPGLAHLVPRFQGETQCFHSHDGLIKSFSHSAGCPAPKESYRYLGGRWYSLELEEEDRSGAEWRCQAHPGRKSILATIEDYDDVLAMRIMEEGVRS